MKRVATLIAALALAAGCKHVPTEKERRAADVHHDLGLVAQNSGNIQEAMREYRAALELNEAFPEAHLAMGLLLQFSFQRQEEAIQHYKRALELKPDYSGAKVNLGTVYMDMGRYDDAIKLFDEALNDMVYTEPYIAHSNRGWSLYKKGDVRGAMESIHMALTINPKFCRGHKNLGLIHDAQGQTEAACEDYRRFKDSCPDAGEAYKLEGVCLAKLGKAEEAKKDFAACQTRTAAEAIKEDCKQLLEQLQ